MKTNKNKIFMQNEKETTITNNYDDNKYYNDQVCCKTEAHFHGGIVINICKKVSLKQNQHFDYKVHKDSTIYY